MNNLSVIENSAAKMTSLEIAEMVDVRHDNVKRAIGDLINEGVIAFPQFEEKPTAGRPVMYYVFEGRQGKRDSIVVVARLSPKFTANLVDRWMELEKAQTVQSLSVENIIQIATQAAISAVSEKKRREKPKRVDEEKPVVDGDDDLMCVGGLAKAVGLSKREMYAVLDAKGFYRRHIMSGKRMNNYPKWAFDKGYAVVTKHHTRVTPMFTKKAIAPFRRYAQEIMMRLSAVEGVLSEQ